VSQRQEHDSASGARGRYFRPDIEGLRAVAILCVVLFHAGVPLFHGGLVGVDVFFVISGFVITALLVRLRVESIGTPSSRFADFYARRARRIIPAASVALIITALFSWLILGGEGTRTGWDITAAATWTANLRFAVTQTAQPLTLLSPSPVEHFWSLSVEEQFYLVWPLLLLIALILTARKARSPKPSDASQASNAGSYRLMIWLLGALSIVSFGLSILLTVSSPMWAFYSTPTRLWELGAGGILALWVQHDRNHTSVSCAHDKTSRWRATIGWSGFIAIIAAAVTFDENTLIPGPASLIPVLGALAIIAAGSSPPSASNGLACGSVGSVLAGRAPRAIGRISYSWYLWHWPVLVLGSALIVDNRVDRPIGQLWPWSAGVGCLLITLSLVPALLSYVGLEQPLRASRALRASNGRTFALAAGFTTAAVCAGLLLSLT